MFLSSFMGSLMQGLQRRMEMLKYLSSSEDGLEATIDLRFQMKTNTLQSYGMPWRDLFFEPCRFRLLQKITTTRLSSSLVPSVEALFETANDHNAEIPPVENAENFEKAIYGVQGDCPLPFFFSEETKQKKKCNDCYGGKRE